MTSPTFSRMTTLRLTTLDAARGIAALLVIVFHMRSYGHIKFEDFTAFDLFSKAYLAVDFFFLLSGYVIARSYEQKLRSTRMSVSEFFVVRIIRLYPLYALGTAFGILGSLWLNPEISGNITLLTLAALGLPQVSVDPAIPPLYPFNGVAWSLGCEMFINILWAIALFRLPLRYLLMVTSFAAAAMVEIGLDFGSLMFGSFSEDLPGAIARVYVSFVLGTILYRLHEAGRLPALRLSSAGMLALLALALAGPFSALGVSYDFAFVLVISPLLLIAGAQVEPGARLSGLCHQLGRLSYALYVLHLPCIKAVSALWPLVFGAPIAATPLIGVVVTLTFVIAVSALATTLFDEPLRAALSAWQKQRRLVSMPNLATGA